MYALTLNEMKAVLKVRAQAGQRRAVNKISAESTAQDDDFQEIKGHKKHISNSTSQRAKKSTKSAAASAAVKLPPKAVLTRNIFPFLRTTDMDTETTGADTTLLEQEAPRKSGRQPTIVKTSTTNLIRIQSDLKNHAKGEYDF
jgi:hypothetical protein